MLHPALIRALATAHVDDLHRAAASRHAIRLARRSAPDGDGITPTEINQAVPRACQTVLDAR